MSDIRSKNRIRLTRTEIEKLVSEERKKWRAFRIQQVHHQSREQAARIREACDTAKKRCVSEVQKNVLSDWQKEKENNVERLEDDYAQCLSAVGQAHRNATEQPRVSEVLAEQAKWNSHLAAQRGREASKREKELQNEKDRKALGGILCRKKAIHVEKMRAKQVANLPTPEAFQPKMASNAKPVPLVLKYEAGTFMTSAYAPTGALVEKEIMSTYPNAKLRAKMEQKALEAEAEERARENEVTMKKVNERGKLALQQEHTKNLYEELLKKLEKTKKDYDLSVYLQGADFNLLETEDQRLKRLSTLQESMEKAVEKVLEESESQSVLYDKTTSHTESTDLKETSDTPDYSAPGLPCKVGDLQDLLRKIREYRESVIESSDGSNSGISSSDSGNGSRVSSEYDVTSKEEGKGEDNLPVIEEDERKGWIHERVGLGVSPATGSTTTEMPCTSTSEDREEKGSIQDIHLAETVPVDRLGNKIIDKQKLQSHKGTPSSSVSTEVGECAPIEAVVSQSGTGMSSVEDSNDASEGLELRILIDQGHAPEQRGPETQVYSDHLKDMKISKTMRMTNVYEKEPTKIKDTNHEKQESSSSTSYLSLPSRLHAKTMDDIEANLRQIQSQRPKIQKMLDDLTSPVLLPSHSTPITAQDVHTRLYREELKEEGSGKRPVKKKHRFEFHRKQVLKHYTERLLKMKQEEIQQISASTVNSSGLTISSLGQLSSIVEKNDDKSLDKSCSSSQSPITTSGSVSSSSLVPQYDTDEVPTKLSCIRSQSEENAHSVLKNDHVLLSQLSNHFSKCESSKTSPGSCIIEDCSSSSSVVEPSRRGSSLTDAGYVENLRKECQLVGKILELQHIKKRLLQQQEAAVTSEGVSVHSELDIQVPERDAPITSSTRIKEVRQSLLRERKATFRGRSSGDSDQTESRPSTSSDSSYQTPSHKLELCGGEAKDGFYIEKWQQSRTVGALSGLNSDMKTSKSLPREKSIIGTHSIPDSGLSRRLDYSKASPDFSRLVPKSFEEKKVMGRINGTTISSTGILQKPFSPSCELGGSYGKTEFTSSSESEDISRIKALDDQEKVTSPQDVSQSLSVDQDDSHRSDRPVADETSSSASVPDMTAVLERFGLTLP